MFAWRTSVSSDYFCKNLSSFNFLLAATDFSVFELLMMRKKLGNTGFSEGRDLEHTQT
jgi:hypothetical protein